MLAVTIFLQASFLDAMSTYLISFTTMHLFATTAFLRSSTIIYYLLLFIIIVIHTLFFIITLVIITNSLLFLFLNENLYDVVVYSKSKGFSSLFGFFNLVLKPRAAV